MQCFVDRNTFNTAFLIGNVLFFARSVDAAAARSFAAGAQFAQNVAGGLFEGISFGEGFDIDGNKEVPQVIGLFIAFRRKSQQTFEESPLLQSGAEDLHHRRVAITFEAGSFFAQTAQRSQRGGAFYQVNKDLFCISTGVAFAVDDPAGRQFLAFAGVNFDLAALAYAGGAVQEERKLFIAGNGKSTYPRGPLPSHWGYSGRSS